MEEASTSKRDVIIFPATEPSSVKQSTVYYLTTPSLINRQVSRVAWTSIKLSVGSPSEVDSTRYALPCILRFGNGRCVVQSEYCISEKAEADRASQTVVSGVDVQAKQRLSRWRMGIDTLCIWHFSLRITWQTCWKSWAVTSRGTVCTGDLGIVNRNEFPRIARSRLAFRNATRSEGVYRNFSSNRQSWLAGTVTPLR